jgi:Zn-finger nucleic acid-binding protein
MAVIATPEGEVDRCKQCHGIWFDAAEDSALLKHAATVDTGSAETGAKFNSVDRIRCPVCPNSMLLRMVDPVQPHIWFESCPTCHGRFFDAGEFRDLAELTMADLLKRFKTVARH